MPYFNYSLDFPQHWSKLLTSGVSSPPARFHHVACNIAPPTDQDYPLLLVGGGATESGGILKDMWALDVGAEEWSEVSDLICFVCVVSCIIYSASVYIYQYVYIVTNFSKYMR